MSVNPRCWLNRQWLGCLLVAPAFALAVPFAYVADGIGPGHISVIDTETNTVVATVAVGTYSVRRRREPRGHTGLCDKIFCWHGGCH